MEIHTEVKSELNKTLLRICVPGITEADYQMDATDESDKRSAACCYTR